METAQIAQFLAPYYLQIKFVHLLFAGMWLWSTSVAYTYYLVPLYRQWMKHPYDEIAKQRRDWAMERFDEGAKLEHIAFPILLITGPMLMLAGGWSPAYGWFAMKLTLIVLMFIPIEVMDYYLAHFGGNKEKLFLANNEISYENAMRIHWVFLVVTTPIVAVSIPYVFYLAVVKPF